MQNKWYEKSFRRNLIDMHIPDWDDKFLSEFDPKSYADALSLAEIDTAIIYASSCLGICYWPTKAGYMHKNLNGRDIFGETVKECRNKGFNIIAYFNIWSRWAYDNYPDWRIYDSTGRGMYVDAGQRFGLCCPNSPFKDYVKKQIVDLCSSYDFEGLWIDMIGWYGITCHCPHCRKRYLQETGRELPKTVDWGNPDWVEFQRKREQWLAEFAAMITNTAKEIKPVVTVTHQVSAVMNGWGGGTSYDFFNQCDYLAGDFYGNSVQQSFICKFLNNITKNKPIEFFTSRCQDLTYHTTNKSEDLLKLQVYSSITNNASFVMIDAIDPVGTINSEIYKMMGRIFRETMQYEKYIDPSSKSCADVAIYVSLKSMINYNENGKSINTVSEEIQPLKKAYTLAKLLINSNIPYGVVTGKDLSCLADYQVIIMPDVIVLDADEIKALVKYVEAGGSIYASRNTSILTDKGTGTGNFLLSDLFGVTYEGETSEDITYVSPNEGHRDLFNDFSEKYPLMISGRQIKVKPKADADILAKLQLPYCGTGEIYRFSSAISNPPAFTTEFPSVVFNRYGKGKVIYSAGELEITEIESHSNVFTNLLKMLMSRSPIFKTNAPKSVEITVFHQEDNRRYIVNILNFQNELPNLPVNEIAVSVYLGEKIPCGLSKLPEMKAVDYSINQGYIDFKVTNLEDFQMFALDYK